MRKILCAAAAVAMGLLAWSAHGATPAKKKAPARKSAPKSAGTPRKSTAHKSTAHASKAPARTPAVAARRGKKAPAKRTSWRNRQAAPTPERYRQIQDALAAKGYLRPEDSNGIWNQTSMDALKKFQADQNLDTTGKINSLSLIALGLGPKREPVSPPKPADQGQP